MGKNVDARTRLAQARRFIRPIPVEERKQVFLPSFTLTLIRTPYLPPRYAAFWVPLTFNKLDIKDYLKRVYNVHVLKVRSFVEQQKPTRELSRGREGYGKWRRPQARKKMTVEMTDPFVWPEEPKDMEGWEKQAYFRAKEHQIEMSDSFHPDANQKPNKKLRESLADHAARLREEASEGGQPWTPTWQALGLNYNRPALGGAARRPTAEEEAEMANWVEEVDETEMKAETETETKTEVGEKGERKS
ncbi:hypothetical protein FQN52_002791 [Onygenales sp. PD_12]|nr:hypothetical protein FQN52_002791 [Onygenales sp. PD_12]